MRGSQWRPESRANTLIDLVHSNVTLGVTPVIWSNDVTPIITPGEWSNEWSNAQSREETVHAGQKACVILVVQDQRLRQESR